MYKEDSYNIAFDKVTAWHTPGKMRMAKMSAWLRVLTAPVNYLYSIFLSFRSAMIYELGFTPQVCSLERLLNDRYDFTQRRIYIDDAAYKPSKFIYQTAELKPMFIRKRSEAMPVFIYTSGEGINGGDDFVVYIPLDIVLELAEAISLIRKFKLAGKRFKIQRF